jgi:LacI family transcriptional regulator
MVFLPKKPRIRKRRASAGNEVGIFVQAPDNAFTTPLLQGIEAVLKDFTLHRMSDVMNAASLLDSKSLRGFAGIIAIAREAPDDLLRQIHGLDIPLALISHQVPGLSVPAVLPNNAQGIARLVEHVVRVRGCRLPVFLGGLQTQVDAIQREEAFRAELLRYNIVVPESYFLKGDFHAGIAAFAMREFLRLGEPFDALICADYLMGLSALGVLEQAGIAVPDQVAVAAFDDSPEADAAGLTTVADETAELGRCAARQVLAQINGVPVRGVTTLGLQFNLRRTA